MEYNLAEMKSELVSKIDAYLAGSLSETELRDFALDQYWKWAEVEDDTLPEHSQDDSLYWATIDIIWHLNEEPIEFHSTDEDLRTYRLYLLGLSMPPASVVAFRPTRHVNQSAAYLKWVVSGGLRKKRTLP